MALVGVPVVLLALAMLAFLAGAPILFWAACLTLVLPIAYWSTPRLGMPFISKLWRCLALLFWVPAVVFGFLAPIRALAVWLALPASGTAFGAKLEEIWLLQFDFHLLNALIGLCGMLFASWGSLRALKLLAQIRRQLENLPRSKAAHPAQGLAEFSGKVVPVDELVVRQPLEKETPGLPGNFPRPEADAVLWRAEMLGGGGEYRELRSRFFLEDESGRILVDGEGVKFSDSFGGFLDSRIENIALVRGLETRLDSQKRIFQIHRLKAGQEVYVIGTVQYDQTSGGLKVAPAKTHIELGLFDRIFPSRFVSDPVGYSSTFLISDARESLTWLGLKKSRKQAFAGAVAWLVISALFMVSELSLTGPGHWWPSRIQAFLDGPPPPPPPPAPLPHDMIFTVTDRHYMGYWTTGPDRLGSVNGNWLPGGIETLQKRVAAAAPRIVIVIEAGGFEQKLIEALRPMNLRVVPVPLSALEDYAASAGGTAGNIWTQSRFAAHYAAAHPAQP